MPIAVLPSALTVCESMAVKPVKGIFSLRPNSEYCWIKRTPSAPGSIGPSPGGNRVGAGAGDDVKSLLLFHVIEHGKRHIARLNPNDQFNLIALDELLGFLQPDLWVKLIVFLDEFDLNMKS
jgi:hypothetical protein